MDENEQAPFSLLASLRRIADTVFCMVQNRIELLALELQEEKLWLISTMLWAGAAVFFCSLAIIFVVVTVVWVVPERAQPWVLGGFSAFFVAFAVTAVSGLRRQLQEKPSSFSETVSELKKDIEWIRSRE